ncbi:MAG: TIGR03960 family B12-binding radical SAM protein [Lachnospiraceae bacterium]|nr:TIGR03960 family B12-binding radical SAM protein [Lachnospiraceae bacterium]
MRKLALSDEILLSIDKPSRYTGGEYNSYNKPWDSVTLHAAFCFPDVYEIATANLGMQIIYEQFNRRPDALCDRVYSPWLDLDKIMRERKIPLFAVESQQKVRDFDLLLITLQYEMCYTNVLGILDLSGIPLHASDRTEEDPIVIGGGTCTYNPEPMADFFDVFYMGESETQYDRVMDILIAAKNNGQRRITTLEQLAEVPGLYVPQFYEARYHEDGTLASFTPVNPHGKTRIRKEIVADMSADLPYPKHPIVPFTRGMMDRATLEVMRGCIRGCRFCQAGMIYRPVRNRSLEFLKKTAVEMLESSGYEEINLSSLSTSDYSEFAELLDFLLPYCEEHKINIGIPSLRIDAFSLDVMDKIQDIKKTSLTFAPEAGSQRLRDVINKGLTEEEILEGARQAFTGGWNKVKLYFMLGQPLETEEDVKAIPVLADKIARVYYETVPKEQRQGKVSIQSSTSFFVTKPFTPFQWAPMCREEEFTEKAMLVKETFREQLNRKSLVYHYHAENQTELEGLFARGDRRVGRAIEEAYRRGCIYDAWGEYLKYDVWLEVLNDLGLSFEFYNFRERPIDELFPWDFIDIGVTKEFLAREWQRAKEGKVTPNCREQCSGCGARCFGGGVCFEGQN